VVERLVSSSNPEKLPAGSVATSTISQAGLVKRVGNEEILLRVKEQGNVLHEISKRRANWIGHVLRRNCLLQRVIEGKIKGGIEVKGGRGRRRRKLLGDLKERRGYCHLKEEVLDRTVWRGGFGDTSDRKTRKKT